MSRNLEILLFQFRGQINLSIEQVAQSIGYDCNYCRNLISQNNFPIKTFKIGESRGSRRMVNVADLADYLDKVSNSEPAKRRGPKTKAQKIAEAAAVGVAA
jgi:hypothetical protein